VLVIGRVIVGVVSSCGMAGLTDAVPGLVSFVKGEVIGALLEDRLVKSTCNVPWFFSDEL
jgi:hypothetical protein